MENIEINQKINKYDIIHPKCVIYKYTELETGIYYIGSTTNKKQRHSNHKSDFYNENLPSYNKPFYVELRRQNKNINNCSYEIIKKYYDISRKELSKHEEEYIKLYKNDELNCNKYSAYTGLTQLEQIKKRQLEKKEEIKEYNKKFMREYYELNKDKILEQKRKKYEENKGKKIECHICKCSFLYHNKHNHYYSQKHKKNFDLFKIKNNIID